MANLTKKEKLLYLGAAAGKIRKDQKAEGHADELSVFPWRDAVRTLANAARGTGLRIEVSGDPEHAHKDFRTLVVTWRKGDLVVSRESFKL